MAPYATVGECVAGNATVVDSIDPIPFSSHLCGTFG